MIQVFFAGRLGRDAELRHTPAGKAVSNFSVAVDSRRNGEKVTDWVDCAIWEKRGEALNQYLTKGTAVSVTGEHSIRTYQAKDGSTKFAIVCTVREITLLGSGDRAGQPPAPVPERAPAADKPAASGDAPYNDDIPF